MVTILNPQSKALLALAITAVVAAAAPAEPTQVPKDLNGLDSGLNENIVLEQLSGGSVGHLSKRAVAPVPIPPFDPITKKKKKLKKKLKKLLFLAKPLKKSPKLIKLAATGASGLGGAALLASQVIPRVLRGGARGAAQPFRPPPPRFLPIAQGGGGNSCWH